jgi:AraC-like DNA-binding protein
MASPALSDPLQRYPVFRTTDPDEFRNALLTRFGAIRADVKHRSSLRAMGNLVQLQDLGLVYGACNFGALVDYPEGDRFRLLTAMTGKCEATIGRNKVTIDGRQSCIISPGQSTGLAVEGSHDWLNIRINSCALERKLACLLGARPNGRFEFEAAVDRNHPQLQNLWRLVRFFAEQLDAACDPLPTTVLYELEEAILVAFLYANPHTFSHLLDRKARDTVPSHVRLAEQYIEAHWDRAIGIESLVEETGVGARAIFRSFRKTRGYSPMAFARMVRLKEARKRLSAPNAETSVTKVAFACGFGNLGHFARDYRKAFGERPSETLARTAGTSPR